MMLFLTAAAAIAGLASAGHPKPSPVVTGVAFNSSQSSYMVRREPVIMHVPPSGAAAVVLTAAPADPPTPVLQQSPAKAAVYGTVEAGGTGVTITVAGGSASGMASYTVPATLKSGEWKALLKPAAAGGSYTITAKCTGCKNATDAVLTDVTFGDVWYCGGQVMPRRCRCHHPALLLSKTLDPDRVACNAVEHGVAALAHAVAQHHPRQNPQRQLPERPHPRH